MKINDTVKLKNDTTNVYKKWDKNAILKIINIKKIKGVTWLTLKDDYGATITTTIENIEIPKKLWKVFLSCNGGDFMHIVEASSEDDLIHQLCALDIWNYVTKYWGL